MIKKCKILFLAIIITVTSLNAQSLRIEAEDLAK